MHTMHTVSVHTKPTMHIRGAFAAPAPTVKGAASAPGSLTPTDLEEIIFSLKIFFRKMKYFKLSIFSAPGSLTPIHLEEREEKIFPIKISFEN